MSTTINASTSVVLVSSSNGPYVVYFPPLSTIGRLISVRDNNGYVSTGNYITLSTINGASFGAAGATLQITQPFGFLTLNTENSATYSILNTFAFPAGSTSAYVSNVTVSTLVVQSEILLKDQSNNSNLSLYASNNALVFNNLLVGDVTSTELISTTLGVEDYASNLLFYPQSRRVVAVGYTSNTVSNIYTPAGTIIYSDNNFPFATAIDGTGGFSNGGVDVVNGGGLWVACGNNQGGTGSQNTGFIQWSLGGSYWNNSTSPSLDISQGRTRVFWANNLYHALGSNTDGGSNTILVSADGKTWVASQTSPQEPFQNPGGIGYGTGIAFGCNVWVATGVQGNTNQFSLLWSANGSNWNSATTTNWNNTPGFSYDVAFNGSRFLSFVGNDSATIVNIAYSTDGKNWALTGSGANTNFNNEAGFIAAPNTGIAIAVSASYRRFSVDGGLTWLDISGLPSGAPSRPYFDGSTWWISFNTNTNAQSIWYSFNGSNDWNNWLNGGGYSNKGYARGFNSYLSQSNLNLQLISTVAGISQNFTVQNLGASTLTFTYDVKIRGSGSNIAIGNNAGNTNQGSNAIAIGPNAGAANQSSNSIAFYASNSGSLSPANPGFYVAPVRSATNTNILYYDTTTKEISYGLSAGGVEYANYASNLFSNSNYTVSNIFTTADNIKLGGSAGQTGQGVAGIAIGSNAGQLNQGVAGIAIGQNAGSLSQSTTSIAIGLQAGQNYQGISAVAIGNNAAQNNQRDNTVAIGIWSGYGSQGQNSVAIGPLAGSNSQDPHSVAIGSFAATDNQGNAAVAIGKSVAQESQGIAAIAIGSNAGYSIQGPHSIAIGTLSGNITQGSGAIGIGAYSGSNNQGSNAIAIGSNAGLNNQSSNSIALYASNSGSLSPANPGFYVAPVRSATNTNILYYDTTTKEISYGLSAGGVEYANYASNLFSNSNYTVSNIFTTATNIKLGFNAGQTGQGANTVAIGIQSGNTTQGQNSIAIGALAGSNNQGSASIAIGSFAATNNQSNASIAIGNYVAQESQGIAAIAIGSNAGYSSQGTHSIAIGRLSGYITQGNGAIGIGAYSGNNNQGSNAIAIGCNAGKLSQSPNSIVLYASNSGELNPANPGFYVAPVRSATNTNILYYDTTTKEISYSTQGTVQYATYANEASNLFSNSNYTVSNIFTTANNIKLGGSAGQTGQGVAGIAIGSNAGNTNQGPNAIAIGYNAGCNSQLSEAIAIGNNAGSNNQNANAIAIGRYSGHNVQKGNAVAIGNQAGSNNQGINSVALGVSSGYSNQGQFAVAIGCEAGVYDQGSNAVAIGIQAAYQTQLANAVAIGNQAGSNNQGVYAVALGGLAGNTNQSSYAVAIGCEAGRYNQGSNSIAIGCNAGHSGQAANSIVLNASGSPLNGTTANALFVRPIRNDTTPTNVLFYNTGTYEISYGTNANLGTLSVNGALSGSYPFFVNASGGWGIGTPGASCRCDIAGIYMENSNLTAATLTSLAGVNAGGNSLSGVFRAFNNPTPGLVSIVCYSNDVATSGDIYFQVERGWGSVLNKSGTYAQLSDSNIKENIQTSRNYLEDLNKIRVVKYNYISSTETCLGVIAQEVAKVFPGLTDNTTSTLAVKMSIFTPMLITAVQSLHSTNQGLQETVNLQQQQISLLFSSLNIPM